MFLHSNLFSINPMRVTYQEQVLAIMFLHSNLFSINFMKVPYQEQVLAITYCPKGGSSDPSNHWHLLSKSETTPDLRSPIDQNITSHASQSAIGL
ncbi:hypothetical protein PoB_004233800 [Plakobranchus ocellatus]|uniref:Uncharacterized protein n=1 Tax=Plakobranchus ocellatus TaxID=259542 RepID=A0AAV4B8A1_9GAST|nr:hypothetical protein PoB_004233800 [Plakobranchus ocellatus]